MKPFYTLILCALWSFRINAQDLGNIKKQKPFTISGSIGASANFYNSNEPVASRPPFGWNIYGNFTPAVYGIALPVSFVVNQYGKSYQQPFTMFGISPTYKWAKLLLGYRNIQFSPVTFDGQSFRGAGLELNPGKFRFAAFYGKLNRKVNEDTTSGRFTPPQFSRIGYGVKIGVGTSANYFDLIYFHAKDDSSSSKVISKQNYRPQENTVIGSSFKISMLKKIIFTTDFSISGLTQDIAAPNAVNDSSGSLLKLMKKFVTTNSSTVANWAGQSTLQFVLKGFNSTIGYRRVQPNFKSLGTPYMLNDVELLNWMNYFTLAKGKLNITTNVSGQHNDLDKKLATELQTLVGNLSLNAQLMRGLNVNFNYSGYQLNQKDGTTKINDSLRLNQLINQISITPSYTILKGTKSHTISSNVSYMLLNDKNPVTSPYTNSNNLSTSLNYTLGLTQHAMSFTVSGLYNQYKQDTNYHRSYGATIGSSAQVLKNKSLSLQGSVGYLFNKSSFGNAQNNLTFSGNIGYHVKHHSLSFYANYIYTPYNPINNIIYKNVSQAVATKNMAGGVSYNYSF
jgi:hypothetical protein